MPKPSTTPAASAAAGSPAPSASGAAGSPAPSASAAAGSAAGAAGDCDITKLAPLAADKNLPTCTTDSGLQLVPSPKLPTEDAIPKICKSEACQALIKAVKDLKLGDCTLSLGVGPSMKLESDFINVVESTCAKSGNATAGNSSASSAAGAKKSAAGSAAASTPAASKGAATAGSSAAPKPTTTPKSAAAAVTVASGAVVAAVAAAFL
ncbi:TPA: hypothetical protein N0F65_003764 [Lagenidium giganteum]|uniref:Elicitin-like protein n=1 Tax=Lagenidium giganteum TaxID=4803 RepID=A0AAV2YJY0_9STRA|nr:TPA: hypothetical protein N0F65_003764 [Lagenidium giganteum]